jgi:hypothetical protein
MFASNRMDGRLKIIDPASLLQKGGLQNNLLASIVPLPKDSVPEEYFVDCAYGVTDAEYF